MEKIRLVIADGFLTESFQLNLYLQFDSLSYGNGDSRKLFLKARKINFSKSEFKKFTATRCRHGTNNHSIVRMGCVVENASRIYFKNSKLGVWHSEAFSENFILWIFASIWIFFLCRERRTNNCKFLTSWKNLFLFWKRTIVSKHRWIEFKKMYSERNSAFKLKTTDAFFLFSWSSTQLLFNFSRASTEKECCSRLIFWKNYERNVFQKIFNESFFFLFDRKSVYYTNLPFNPSV